MTTDTDNKGHCKTCEVLADRIADLERKLACARAEMAEDVIARNQATVQRELDGYIFVPVSTLKEAQAALYGCREILSDISNTQHAINLLFAARGEK